MDICLMDPSSSLSHLKENDYTESPEGIHLPDMSDYPIQFGFFFVVMASSMTQHFHNCEVKVSPYENDLTNFKNLMEELLLNQAQSKLKIKYHCFSLNNGIRLDPLTDIRTLKKLLRKQCIDGIILFLEQEQKEIVEGSYLQEGCLLDYFDNQSVQPHRKLSFTLRFDIYLDTVHKIVETLYIHANPLHKGEDLCKQFLIELKKQFQVDEKLEVKDIEKIQIADLQNHEELKQLKMGKILADQEIFHETILRVRFAKQLNLRRVKKYETNAYIIIYRQNQSSPIKCKYDDIANLTFSDLYKKHLVIQQSKMKKDAVFCLKIIDMIVKPYQKINVASRYFMNRQLNKAVCIVAKVVTQKMVFYKMVPLVLENPQNQFRLAQLSIPKQSQVQKKLLMLKRKSISEKSSIEYFKDQKHVEPILVYTSQLQYQQIKTGSKGTVYASLNKFLRNTTIISLDQKYQKKDWKFAYTATLIKSLNNAKRYQGICWRGINYDPKIKAQHLLKIFTLKGFISASKNKQTAFNFSKNKSKPLCHIYEYKVKSGRQIRELSYNPEEEQILLEPYTQFVLKNIRKQSNYVFYQMQEKVSSRQLPNIKTNFVVWIEGGDSGEPENIYETIKKSISETTCFIRLRSNGQLAEWLERHKYLLKDKTANTIFITNMKRIENGVEDQLAGVKTVNIIRKQTSAHQIYFYIGNIDACNKKLAENKIQLSNIVIGNERKNLMSFFSNLL